MLSSQGHEGQEEISNLVHAFYNVIINVLGEKWANFGAREEGLNQTPDITPWEYKDEEKNTKFRIRIFLDSNDYLFMCP